MIITDSNGCQFEDTVNLESRTSYLIVPNVFTPNDDGINDLFNVNHENIVSFNGFIANRWGEIIYKWIAIDNGWDGRSSAGIPYSSGTYFYVINALGADDKKYNLNGHLRLIK